MKLDFCLIFLYFKGVKNEFVFGLRVVAILQRLFLFM